MRSGSLNLAKLKPSNYWRPFNRLGSRSCLYYSTTSPTGSAAVPASASSDKSTKNLLPKYLIESIKTTGPISLAAYMRQCLTSDLGGYYINRDPFGVTGDFITSPEISQMFGELVGIWVLTQWLAQGCPAEFRVVEYGPGRGTLIADFLRATHNFKDFSAALKEVHLVEASPALREVQRSALCSEAFTKTETGFTARTKQGISISWHELSKDVPEDMPTFIIAHEFFDALPIHQFEHTDKGWRELLVDYSVPVNPQRLPGQTSNLDPSDPTFHLTLSPHSTPSSRIVPQNHSRYSKLPVGSKIEVCPEAWDIAQDFSRTIETCGGAALIIDYGSTTIPVDSLRGIRNHKVVSPFKDPGDVDLSVDVDFTAIKDIATTDHSVDVHGPVKQGDWLHAMGIGARATALANSQKTDEGHKRIEQAYRRLVEEGGGAMGKAYKVMCIVPRAGPIPVGFGGEVKS